MRKILLVVFSASALVALPASNAMAGNDGGGDGHQTLQKNCQRNRGGTPINIANGAVFICLLPSENGAPSSDADVESSDAVCANEGGHPIDMDGLAFVCVGATEGVSNPSGTS
jgi:hypothetical protein